MDDISITPLSELKGALGVLFYMSLLNQLHSIRQLFCVYVYVALCCSNAAVSSKFCKHTHSNAFACQACNKRPSAAVWSCVFKAALLEDVYEQLAHCVGAKETAFLTAEQWRCVLFE